MSTAAENALSPEETATTKLYSKRAISITTFFGGPLAATILVRQNFLNLGKPEQATHTLFIGVLASILLIVGLFTIPDEIFEKIPNTVIPLVYTGLITLAVQHFQGAALETHKANNGPMYSAWKAAGIGAVSCVVYFGAIFAALYYLTPADFDADRYDHGIEAIQANEEEALRVFTLLDNQEFAQAEAFITSTALPAWQKNIHILNELDTLQGLDAELVKQNKLLRQYCELRIAALKLTHRALQEDSDSYDAAIQQLNQQIEAVIDSL